MKRYNQWVLWRKSSKGVKILFQINGEPAKVNDSSTWSSFLEVSSYYKQNQSEYNGIGYVFHQDDPYTVIDLDNKNNNKRLSKYFKSIIKKMNSYTEISQSQKGYHIIIKQSHISGDRRRKDNYETYNHGRFIAITGDLYHKKYSRIRSSSYFNEFYQKHINHSSSSNSGNDSSNFDDSFSDEEVLGFIRSGTFRTKFNKMLDGKLIVGEKYKNPDYPSFSEMDFAFCSIVSNYTQDITQIERIYQKTRLSEVRKKSGENDKWKNREDYRIRTIENAIKAVGKNAINKGVIFGDKGVQILYPKFAKYLLKKIPCFSPKGQEQNLSIYYYQDGIYIPGGTSKLENEIINEVGDLWVKKYTEETMKAVKSFLSIKAEEVELNPDDECIVVQNGVLNLYTLTLSEFTSDRVSTVKFPISFDKKEKCPKTMEFLKEVMHKDTIPSLFEFIGDTIRHGKPRYPKMLILKGPSRTGKSTIIDLIEAMIGRENRSVLNPSDIIKDDRYGRIRLYGKYANIKRDMESMDIENPEAWKEIIEGEPIQGREIHKSPVDFEPFARHVFGTNKIPALKDSAAKAIIDRSLIIPVDKKRFYSDDPKRIPDLSDQLIKTELPGMFNMALKGLHRLDEQKRFSETERMKGELQKYHERIDSMAEFISTQCELGKNYRVASKHLYEQFKNWCRREEVDYRNIRKIDFKDKLWDEYQIKYKRLRTKNYGNTQHYIGIKLKLDLED